MLERARRVRRRDTKADRAAAVNLEHVPHLDERGNRGELVGDQMDDSAVKTKPVRQKGPQGRRCTICTHKKVNEINSKVVEGGSFRGIARHFDTDDASLMRHVSKCLTIEIAALLREKKIAQAVNVYEEFTEQLAFAKSLRDTAQTYLSDPDDPFQLFIGPQAHEIDVLYYDFNDMEQVGETERPKKKKAKLNDLLAELAGRGIEGYRVEMKTIDIRKYALDAISTADVCIDKFARMGGAYQKDKNNQADVGELIDGLVERLIAKGWERQAAREFAQSKYNAGGPALLGNGG